MAAFIDRIISAKGDPARQVVDLILFIGYFAACLYAGGVAYELNYNSHFSLGTAVTTQDTYFPVKFATKVLITRWYWIPSSIFMIAFIFLFYSCKYAWRPWFGYSVLSLLFYTTFLICGAVGKAKGSADALSDSLKDSTTLPVVKLFGASAGTTDFSDGSFHLLTQDSTKFFVFEPMSEKASVIQIHVISKTTVQRYEVFVK